MTLSHKIIIHKLTLQTTNLVFYSQNWLFIYNYWPILYLSNSDIVSWWWCCKSDLDWICLNSIYCSHLVVSPWRCQELNSLHQNKQCLLEEIVNYLFYLTCIFICRYISYSHVRNIDFNQWIPRQDLLMETKCTHMTLDRFRIFKKHLFSHRVPNKNRISYKNSLEWYLDQKTLRTHLHECSRSCNQFINCHPWNHGNTGTRNYPTKDIGPHWINIVIIC